MMNIEQNLCMKGGSGETSYAKNSKIQEKTIIETKPLIEEAIREIYNNVVPKKFVAVDLGCSSGPNTFLVLSEIINLIEEHCVRSNKPKPEIQFFLNDLHNNDFNNIFNLLPLFEKKVKQEKGDEFVQFYVAGQPGSFYGRLFPSKSVHLFHSNCSLMWLSQVPCGLEGEGEGQLNKGNIYIGQESSLLVSHLYLEQFKRDFFIFLKSRSKELIVGGRMILSFLGRTNSPSIGGCLEAWGLLSKTLNDMGLMEEDKVNAFNLPFYTPSMGEVKSIIEIEGSFHLIRERSFESNWDPFDESTDNFVVDKKLSGENVAKYKRAVIEPLFAPYFEEEIIEDIFSLYAKNIANHMSKGKPKHMFLILFLKLKDEAIKRKQDEEHL